MQAFRTAATVVDGLSPEQLDLKIRTNTLKDLKGIGPKTAAGHRFWEHEGANRQQQLIHFLKNVGLVGGLLIAAVDTEGKPSVGWRARRAARAAGEVTEKNFAKAQKAAAKAQKKAAKQAADARKQAKKQTKAAKKAAKKKVAG